MASQLIQRQSLCEGVADQIRDSILHRELRPGDALDEAALAARLGVSRTPVREALKLLQHEGLLTATAGRGMAVKVLNEAQRAEAKALHALLSSYLHEHGQDVDLAHDSLARRFLILVEWRLRLAGALD